MINKKIFSKKASICYLQILILIASTFAISYLIYSSIGSVDATAEDDLNELLKDYACCEKTKSPNPYFCQYTKEEQCEAGNFKKSNTQCSETSFCKLGCCVGDAGFCSQNTPQTVCDTMKGKWMDSQYCAVNECQRGCCILGSNSEFITEKNCYFKSKALGLDINFNKAIKSEAECIYATMKEDKGACINDNKYGEVECEFTTRGKCDKNSKFYKDTLCSDNRFRDEYNLPGPICKPQDHIGCLEDMRLKRDFSVYWFDSCGNPDGVVKKADGNFMICDPLINSICGEWKSVQEDKGEEPDVVKERTDGGGIIKSDYICKSLGCSVEMSDGNGGTKFVDKKNEESWCEYLGEVGSGKDVVGSEHIIHRCQNGKEIVDSCADYRREICVQDCTGDDCADSKPDGENTFTTASCVTNGWVMCYQYNADTKCDDKGNCDYSKMKEGCNANSFCNVSSVNIDSYFSFESCTPAYPPGFDVNSEEDNGKAECSFATQTCTMVYQKEFGNKFGGEKTDEDWGTIVGNGECRNPVFVQEMNKFCKSFGDCGLYVNYNGTKTELGFSVWGTDGSNDFIKRINGLNGLTTEILNYISVKIGSSENNGEVPPLSIEGEEGDIGNSNKYGKEGGVWGQPFGDNLLIGSLGLSGTSFIASMFVFKGGATLANVGGLKALALKTSAYSTKGGISSSGASGVGVTALNAAIVFFAMIAIAMILTKGLNLQGQAGELMMISGFIAGGVGAIVVLAGEASMTGYGIPAAIVLLVIAGALKWSKLGETHAVYIHFQCLPSRPQTYDKIEDSKCDFCNQQSICTKYMCESLGTECEFINENYPENRRCISEPQGEISFPVIKYLKNSAIVSRGIPGGLGVNTEDELKAAYYPDDKMKIGVKESENGIDFNGIKIVRLKDDNGNYYNDNEKYPSSDTLMECIPENTKIEFGIKTVFEDKENDNEELGAYADCKISDDPLSTYDEMSQYFGGDNFRAINHTMVLEVKDNADGVADGKVRKFVACARGDKYKSVVPFEIRLCVAEDDRTAPIITKVSPANNPFIKYGATELNLIVSTYEQSTCRWSANDFDYDKMEGAEVNCDSQDYEGYKCEEMKLNIAGNNTKFYLRCKDKSINLNVMTESLVYTIRPSASDLKIDFIAPEKGFEKLIGLNEPAPVTLRVKLSGGAENGNSICSWWETEKGFSDDFDREYKNDHIYDFTSLASRTYYVDIKCEDKANNTASDSTSFSVKVDSYPPRITRYYNDNGKLKVITDEDSKCKFGFSPITEFANATNMVSNDGLTHTADWKAPQTYYMKCEDKFNNRMGVDFKVYTYT